ncbi:60S ribosomal protein L18a-like isoform X1 [Hibiscus syriacus]|uniref:60S ribosomal protein L18a-like isoform X1 n=1 Tax=Hibiscus syriacus TaxID=106335 RepID=A0A6A3BD08_HIBSY|nr:60S ribosomal protein L18a-like protein [Hibiscus syriacus]KAE8713002.1 60S ribosomal protein L18a-like isoform X1 [Hibiscus syriacus]
MNDEGRNRGSSGDQQQQNQYGTFQGVANYPPPRPPRPQQPQQHRGSMGLPQPSPPPSIPTPQYYQQGYQTVPGYAVADGRPVRDELPCCGIGVGWFLFIIGFFLGAVPWYAGFIILAFSRIDYREKPGYIACSIGAFLATIALLVGLIAKAG